MYDIEMLMRLHGKVLDWDLVAGYFEVFQCVELFEELKRKYHAAQ